MRSIPRYVSLFIKYSPESTAISENSGIHLEKAIKQLVSFQSGDINRIRIPITEGI